MMLRVSATPAITLGMTHWSHSRRRRSISSVVTGVAQTLHPAAFEAIVPDTKGSDNMSEKQKELLKDILSTTEKLPEPLQQRLLGVAHGLDLAQSLSMVPGPKDQETESRPA